MSYRYVLFSCIEVIVMKRAGENLIAGMLSEEEVTIATSEGFLLCRQDKK